jgi:hypothetical protein
MTRGETPPPQPPRRSNTAGTSIVTQSRMAPVGGIPLVGLAAGAAAAQERKPQLPARKPTGAVPAPNPVAGAVVSGVHTQQKKGPPPPPAPRKAPGPAVDLLGDDEGMEMGVGGWEALKPS